MFLVTLQVPKKWLQDDPDCEIHWIWECGCEASIYNTKTGQHLSAFSENVRQVYHIKTGPKGKRNDLTDKSFIVAESDKFIEI